MIEIPEQAAIETPERRLRRLIPIVRTLTGSVKKLSVISAISAVVLWWILFNPHLWLAGVTGKWVAGATVVLLALLVPAGAAFVGYRILEDLLDLPDKLKSAVAETTVHARDAVVFRDLPKGGRLFGFFRTIWAARGLVLESKGAWGKAAAAVHVARLASLPFVVGLLVTFALNFVVIALAVFAVFLAVLL